MDASLGVFDYDVEHLASAILNYCSIALMESVQLLRWVVITSLSDACHCHFSRCENKHSLYDHPPIGYSRMVRRVSCVASLTQSI